MDALNIQTEINTKYHFYSPSVLLQPFIKKYIVIESEDEIVNRVLPDTSLVMAFRFKGLVNYVVNDNKLNLPSLVVSGLRKTARLINYTGNSGNVLVLFKEARATSFFRQPLHELFEESVSLDNLFTKQNLTRVEDELSVAEKDGERIAAVERFLLSRLIYQKTDDLVDTAIQKIQASNGLIKVKELAGSLFISQDAFEKRFRRVVGTSPKQFSSIVRMNTVIDSGFNGQTFTDMAFDAGYFDQSHFNKDFKSFTGQSPSDYFNSPSSW